jgi:hypothetical protein
MMSMYCSASSVVRPGSQHLQTMALMNLLEGNARLSSGGLCVNAAEVDFGDVN